jgi:hypothetical protein
MNSTSLGDSAAFQAALDAPFTTDYLPLSLPHLGYLSLLRLPFHSATLAFAQFSPSLPFAFAPSSPSRLPHLYAIPAFSTFRLSLLRLPRARAILIFLALLAFYAPRYAVVQVCRQYVFITTYFSLF